MCGSSGSTSNNMNFTMQNSSQTYDPWVQEGGKNLFTGGQDWLGSHGYQPYTGPLTASFGEPFNQATSYLSELLGKTNPYTTQAGNAAGSVIGAIDPSKSTADYMNEYVGAALTPQLSKIMETAGQQDQANNAAATMQGAFGGTGAGIVKALLNKNTQQEVANATGTAYKDAYDRAQSGRLSNLQTLLSGAQGLSGIGQQAFGQGTTLASLLAGIGTQEQSAGQTGISNAMKQSQLNNTMPLTQFSELARVLGSIPKAQYGSSFGTSMGQQQTMTPNNTGMGIAGSLLSMLLM